MKTRKRKRPVRGIIDGGNVSTALALSHYAKRFNLEARIVMSGLFPKDVLKYVEEATEGHLKTIISPRTGRGREREFYEYLCQVVLDRRQSKGFACLWHAKFGGRALRPMGEALASQMEEMPDAIVLSIGAGAALEGWALPIQERFGMSPMIIAVEHSICPLVELGPKATSRVNVRPPRTYSTEWLRKPPPGIPHSVLGPHYDELNPCIRKQVLDRVNGVVRYTDDQWKQMASHCRAQGLSVGNSSAVNLLVARWLAAMGKSVLTFIYEPCREFYKATEVDIPDSYKNSYSTELQLCHDAPSS
ncbi:pyridoxal-phosphate dependent enzyme [Candidatus Zixiibacteriota bacterium]